MRSDAECAVWWMAPCQVPVADVAMLDDIERHRLRALRFEADRRRFLAAAALLRRVITREVGVPPHEVQIDRSCLSCGEPHGRPRVPGADLHVSVTHTADRVGVALTRVAPVGLDVEWVGGRILRHVTEHVLAADEHAADVAEFYRYWTRKEAVVKATGDGIGVGLTGVRVSAPHDPARLLSYPGVPHLRATLRDLTPGPGYLASVAVLTTRTLTVRENAAPIRRE